MRALPPARRRFTPPISMRPPSAELSPQSIRNVVVLPAPFAPRSPKISPFRTVNDT